MDTNPVLNKNSNNKKEDHCSNTSSNVIQLTTYGELVNTKTKLTLKGEIPLERLPTFAKPPQRTIRDDTKPSSLWGTLRALFFVFM